MATKKEILKKPEVVEEVELLTEEEFARRQRKKNKERINKVIRVIGLISTFIIFDAAVFDILFEPSYFGWMWYAITGAEVSPHTEFWNMTVEIGVYRDYFDFGIWLPKLGMTMLLVASVVVVLYLLIYCIIDFIELIRALTGLSRDLMKDLDATAKDGGVIFHKKKEEEEEEKVAPKKANPRRRKENALDKMSDDDLDAILRGELPISDKIQKDLNKTKDLFSEDEE